MRKSILLFGVMLTLAGQPATERFAPLIQTLHLRPAQMAQLRPPEPTPPRPAATGNRVASYPAGRTGPALAMANLRVSILDNTQRAMLTEIEKPFTDLHMRAGAIVMGLIDAAKWGGPGLCYYATGVYADAFGLSDVQVREFDRLEYAARQQDIHARPRRDLAMAVLNESQLARLMTFESNLELGNEAVELHLLAEPPVRNVEVLCH